MELEKTNNDFVPNKESLLLKQIGFDATAPTYRQAFKWFREKQNIDYSIYRPFTKVKQYCWNISNRELNLYYPQGMVGEHAKTYEEAEISCLNKLIEMTMLIQKMDIRIRKCNKKY